MSQDNYVKLKCSECSRINYWVHKNKKQVERKLEFKKFCKRCEKHLQHTESKRKGG